MGSVAYRVLEVDEAKLLGSIDRSERIHGTYRVTNGVLELDERIQEFPTWSAAELSDRVARLQALIGSGGTVISAWDGAKLVGIGSLEGSGVGGDRSVMLLDMLYVSAGYRGRGIGRALTERVAQLARSRGATALYISATPTRGTVDAYLRMGASLRSAPDPELFAREPEDIHLSLDLA